MATTDHLFVHAGHRFQYVLAVADRSFSAEIIRDGRALHRFSSPFNAYRAGTDTAMEVCKRLVEDAIRDNLIRWH